jgi:hypothetical protein
VTKRILVMLLLAVSLSLTGCSRVADFVDPSPDRPCTAFGCHPKQGNIVRELGGIILFGAVIAGGLGLVVRRMTRD